MASKQRLSMLIVPLGFMIFAMAFPMRKLHWDTLERAYVVDFPGQFLHSFDGTPRCLFLHFAHVLELPLAAALGVVTRLHGIELLRAFESIVGAVCLWLVGQIVLSWRMQIRATRAGQVPAAIVAQVVIATCLAYWKMASGAEEKTLALLGQLLFLTCFWRSLEPRTSADPDAAPGAVEPGTAAKNPWPMLAGAALPVAILCHLTGAVLVPFAALVVWRIPDPTRRQLVRWLGVGTALTAVAYGIIAWQTLGVHTPAQFWNYFTFYHHGVENFFELTGADPYPGGRLSRVRNGLASFFSSKSWDGSVPLAIALLWLIGSVVYRYSGTRAARPAAAGAGTWRLSRGIHCLILAALWTAHFAFFEPEKHESWFLPVILLLVAGAVHLPSGRRAWFALAFAALLVGVNVRHYRWNHTPEEMQAALQSTLHASHPGDLLLTAGGRQDGEVLRASYWTRFVLASVRDRQVVSLFDVTGLTEPEYWGRPFTSAAALQAELDRGRRAFAPAFFIVDVQLLEQAGLLRVGWAAANDSVIEITHVEAIPPRPGQQRVVVIPQKGSRPVPAGKVALLPHR